ncbi:MAG TPA: MFS transporter permease, partial [Burkholderiales bacterium]|nr:MFS transporter permease [Burkholderiales bacterium]
MSDAAVKQLDAIHSMLNAGQRNLRMETHSLLLWGLVGGFLCLFSDHILTPQQIPDNTQRAFAWLALLAAILGAAGWVDWNLTRRSKQARDETWSFIHRQIMKFWWLLLSIGALTTFAMFFFGGGYMLFPVWMALLGMGLFVHGLFSAPLLQWTGGLLILTAVCSLGYRLEFETMKWLAGSAYGLGLPLLALVLARKWEMRFPHQLLAVLWLACVIGVPLSAAKLWPQQPPAGETLSLDAYRQYGASGAQILHLPAGTQVPVELTLAG